MQYDLSLIDSCLYAVSPGCKFTISFWAKIPAEPRATLLSTFKTSNDDNTGVSFGAGVDRNGGLFDSIHFGITLTTFTEQLGISPRGVMYPNVWYHIAFAYHNTTDFALYIDFVNGDNYHFVDVLDETWRPGPFTEAYMASGFKSPPRGSYTGFGILDELTVFSEVLSSSQIMQLQNLD